MGDKQIGGLTAGSTPAGGTEAFHAVQGGNSREFTFDNAVARCVFRAYLGSAANSSTSWAKVLLDTVDYDTHSLWNVANKRYIPNRSGYYLFIGRARTSSTGEIIVAIGKNGAQDVVIGSDITGSSGAVASSGSSMIFCNGSTDYLELFAIASSVRAFTTGPVDTWMEVLGPF